MARWKPITSASSIVDSSLLSELTSKKVEMPTKANVKAPRFPMLANKLYAMETKAADATNAIMIAAR